MMYGEGVDGRYKEGEGYRVGSKVLCCYVVGIG